jgi:ABC-2 type transport system ATP-binding protein
VSRTPERVIEVQGLRKAYGDVVATEDVSFDVRRGQIFGLLGPNGAGKTTTVECLQGLRQPDAGRLSVLGLDPRSQALELRRRIGSQLQDSALPDRIKVWEALHLFSDAGWNGDGRDPSTLLDEWGLAEKRSSKFGNLSGGQRQRLFVALALVNDPEVVFLDEMTTGLDPAARREAWRLIEAIRARGTTVVLVTHFMDEAERLCDGVAIIDRGRVVDVGTPQALINRHAGQSVVLFTAPWPDPPELEGVPHVERVTREGDRFRVEGDGPVLAHVAAALVRQGKVPDDLRVHRATLEDVFLTLTGRKG